MNAKRIIIIIVIVSVAIIAGIAALRLFSGEDNWICDNGMWVKHGAPSAPMPTGICPAVDLPEEFTSGPD